MQLKRMVLLVALAVLGGAGVAWANTVPLTDAQMDAVTAGSTNLIKNWSFEQGLDPGDHLPLIPGSTAITNWTVTGGGIDYYGSGWKADNGNRSLDLNGSPGVGGVEQTIHTKTGELYVVRFALAGHPTGLIQTMKVSAGGESHYYVVKAGKNPNHLGWTQQRFSFTATAPETTIQFNSQQYDYPYGGPALDKVSVALRYEPTCVFCKVKQKNGILLP